MRKRGYFSVRTGRRKGNICYDLEMLRKFLLNLYLSYERRGWFQEAYGFYCVDAGYIAGSLGSDIDVVIFLALRKDKMWPIEEHIARYTEDDCFDMLEFLYDSVSKPVQGNFHSYNDCGWHYTHFDKKEGQLDFRDSVSDFLQNYGSGWELLADGDIVAVADEGMGPLLDAKMPHYDPPNVEQRVASAIHKFRSRSSTDEDKRDAIRDLADILEFLRPKAKRYFLTRSDDAALFRIANEFAIRHHNDRQKGDYSITIWYNWIFYAYLSTIHAAVRAIKASE